MEGVVTYGGIAYLLEALYQAHDIFATAKLSNQNLDGNSICKNKASKSQ